MMTQEFKPTHIGIVKSLDKLWKEKPSLHQVKRANANLLLEHHDGLYCDKQGKLWSRCKFESLTTLEGIAPTPEIDWDNDIDWKAVHVAAVTREIPVQWASIGRGKFIGYRHGHDHPYIIQGELDNLVYGIQQCQLMDPQDIQEFFIREGQEAAQEGQEAAQEGQDLMPCEATQEFLIWEEPDLMTWKATFGALNPKDIQEFRKDKQ